MFHVFSFIEQRVRCQKRNDQRVRNQMLTDRGEENRKYKTQLTYLFVRRQMITDQREINQKLTDQCVRSQILIDQC